jgi:DNA-binding MarR family transcriptional regulator
MSKNRPNKGELADAIGDQFRINQNRSGLFDEIANEHLGINQTDNRCLDVLTRLGPITAGELAREAGLTTGGVTAVVDRLERAGFARRVRDDEDRRRVVIEVEPEFFERAMIFWGPMKEAWDAHAARLTREQLEFLLQFMIDSNELGAQQIERIRALPKPKKK